MQRTGPYDKIYAKFKLDEAGAAQLDKMGGELYSEDLRFLTCDFQQEGRKVLVVMDNITKGDAERKEILSGDEAKGFDKLLAWAWGQKADEYELAKVAVLNWPCAWFEQKLSPDEEQNAFNIYFARLRRFVHRWKPESIVLAGVELFEYVLGRLTGKRSNKHRYRANRAIKVDFDGHVCQIVGTIHLSRCLSFDNKWTDKYPYLLGYMGRALLTAMEGYNRHSVKLPKKDKINFNYIATMAQFHAFMAEMRQQLVVSIDTETRNLGKVVNELLSAQFCWSLDSAYFLPVHHPQTPFSETELLEIKTTLKNYFEHGKSRYHIYQNGKFDVTQWHGQLGVRFYNHRIYDVQAGEYALEENRKHLQKALSLPKGSGPYTLGFIAEQYGCAIYRQIEFSKGGRGNIADQKLPDVRKGKVVGVVTPLVIYGCYDVLVPYHVVQCQLAEAKARKYKKYLKFVCEQLSDTTLAFAQMEFTGMRIDQEYLAKLRAKNGEFAQAIRDAATKFRALESVQRVNRFLMREKKVPMGTGLWGNAIWLFDINKERHQQLLFFDVLDLKPLSHKKNGGGKIDKKFQEVYKDVPEIAAFNEYKKLITLRNTFVNGIAERMKVDPDAKTDGHIRASFGYTDVTTSRTSVRDPNTQNLPAHGKLAKIVKRLLIADPGCMLVDNDYSAHEIRDWANQSGDRALANSFRVGLKYRQELRLIAYTHPEEAESWTSHKEKHGWYSDEIKGDAGKKQEIVGRINNPTVKRIAEAELLLELKGDVHKNNCEIFYGVPVLEVTKDQRQGIKNLVFGTIYDLSAVNLAERLGKTEEYAAGLQTMLFEKFPTGANWLNEVKAEARKLLVSESPLGMQRHLWGHLHGRYSVNTAMDRRAPNSRIQGVASCIGISSIRILQKMAWQIFVSQGFDYQWKTAINFVHDSLKSQVPHIQVPISLYMLEHASTTQIHRRYRQLFGYDLKVGLELEFQLGAAASRMNVWNFMEDKLYSTIEEEMKWQKEEMGYAPPAKVIDAVRHNWQIVAALRKRELKEARKSDKPAETMLLNSTNVHELGFKFAA